MGAIGMLNASTMGSAGNGSLKRTRTVWSSTASTRWSPLSWVENNAFVSGFTMASSVNFTSAAVNGLPSCQRTPRAELELPHAAVLEGAPGLGEVAHRLQVAGLVAGEGAEHDLGDEQRGKLLGERERVQRHVADDGDLEHARRRLGGGRSDGQPATAHSDQHGDDSLHLELLVRIRRRVSRR